MKKIFVIDTNVLLMDPDAIFSFEKNEVVIPLAVIEEIDDQKSKNSDIGYNARETSRIIDRLREKGSLNKGINLENGGSLRVAIDGKDLILPKGLSANKMDNRIISAAIHLQNDNPDKKIILISNDINLRLIGDSFGLVAEEHRSARLSDENIFSGWHEIKADSDTIDTFYKMDKLVPAKFKMESNSVFPQEFVQLSTADQDNKSALAKFDGDKIVKLNYSREYPSGIRPRNREQKFAIELLLDDNIKLVTLSGKAGTGKTLLALAAGLSNVMDSKLYERLLIARPIVPMGKDIGFLPGSKEDKMQPWMQPIFDNLNLIFHERKNSDFSYDQLKENELIKIEALTYIRGRSIPEQYIIVDEAQNLSKHEIKTIVTRAGKDSKIVFTGDPYQIDNPYLDLHNNGLTYLAHKFRSHKIAGHIMLERGERSELSEIASKIL